MKLALIHRVKGLEDCARNGYENALEQIRAEAIQAVSDEDLELLDELAKQGGLNSKSTPAQKNAFQAYNAACDRVSMRIRGRPA